MGNDDVDLYNQLWNECAGFAVIIPHIGDRVFYFPQGCLEQIKACMEDRDDPTIPNYGLPSKILCKVVDVELKAFPDTDEVFAEIVLLPDPEEREGSTSGSVTKKIPANSFRKILTTSDTSKHGGCSLPKLCVEKAFPPLDVTKDQSSQRLVAKDLHGASWSFQHVHRGDPKRHLLVTGWRPFTSSKKLKAGDACIFMRGLGSGEIYIGVQRATRIKKVCTDVDGNTMRHGVLFHASYAMNTRTNFEVIYHPRMCASAFIVPYNTVMEALNVNYSPGMRFEMLVDEGDDPEHIPNKFSGIVTAKDDIDPARWPNSEWRCLKVKWDVSSSRRVLPPRVSPWEIQPLGLAVPHRQLSISIDQNRSMASELMIRNNPFSRTSENNQWGGLQSQWLTLSTSEVGSSSRQDAMDMDVDEDE
ncbi:putative transcription factor ARF family [Helianthus annuus]|nr:putative transcription factor ARF family [Helianthus annuus]